MSLTITVLKGYDKDISKLFSSGAEQQSMRRKKTKKIKIGNVSVGGDSPIVVQSMLKTDPDEFSGYTEPDKGTEKSRL